MAEASLMNILLTYMMTWDMNKGWKRCVNILLKRDICRQTYAAWHHSLNRSHYWKVLSEVWSFHRWSSSAVVMSAAHTSICSQLRLSEIYSKQIPLVGLLNHRIEKNKRAEAMSALHVCIYSYNLHYWSGNTAHNKKHRFRSASLSFPLSGFYPGYFIPFNWVCPQIDCHCCWQNLTWSSKKGTTATLAKIV